VENEDILTVLPLLAEKYVKGLTTSELALYESSLKKYSCSEKEEEREWNLSHYLYLNQWIINSMYQKDHPDDIQILGDGIMSYATQQRDLPPITFFAFFFMILLLLIWLE
jgi:hypothetical protein